MATTTGSWNFYDSFREYLGDGTIDLDNDAFKVQLHTSTYTPAASHSQKSNLTNEVANGNGYTTGGAALVTPTWVRSGGTVTFDAVDTQWSATGAGFTAHYWVLLDDTITTPVTDALIAYGFLDNSPADVTTTAGNTLTIQWNGSGLFTLT